MRAYQVTELTGPDGVHEVRIAEPLADGRVLIDVQYAGVAFPDLLQTRGGYQVCPELPFVPGFEVAGTVRSAPEGSLLRAGTRVAAISRGGGAWQDVMAVPEHRVFPLPDGLSTADGAGLLLNYLTCDFALRHRGRARSGETVLVHGAAGGVGVAGLRLAAAYGLRTVAVVSEPAKVPVAQRAGAQHTLLAQDWRAELRELLGPRALDLVLDPVGGDRVTDSIRELAPEGRLLIVGFTAGEIPTVKVNRLLLTNTEVIGVAWAEFVGANPGYAGEQWARLLPMLADGSLTVEPVTEYPVERLRAALRAIESRAVRGKVVLKF